MKANTLKWLRTTGFLDALDLQVADLATRIYPQAPEVACLAAALASRAIRHGHACVDLHDYAAKSWEALLAAQHPPVHHDQADECAPPVATPSGRLPVLADWLTALPEPLFGTGAETGKDRTLLVRNDSRIYLRRYWNYERKLEAQLHRLNRPTGLDVDTARLNRFFQADNPEQRAAARNAIERQLSLLSGGPGTGKTYTLARAVALLVQWHQGSGRTPMIRLAAPTGKAAVRMMESLKAAKATLQRDGISAATIDAIPEEASTLHRLLGTRRNSPYFKHDARNPLTADLVIVDEASMVDLPLMAKLLDALPDACGLLLVGDIDQLASVEPGRVYGDLCQAAGDNGPLAGCLTRLTRSRRFPDDSTIGKLSRYVNGGEADQAWAVLTQATEHGPLQQQDARRLEDSHTFVRFATAHMRAFLEARDPACALAAAGQFRILCALRNGPYGVTRMNAWMEQILAGMGLSPAGRFYDHQLIMISVNTPSLRLFNGDIGVVFAKPGSQHDFEAWFPDPEQGLRAIPVGLLPDHETAFAMTIHKSQGSEFPHVALILPDSGTSPILTRELLYTGITRVALDTGTQTGALHIWCTEQSFKHAVAQKTTRATGLFKAPASV